MQETLKETLGETMEKTVKERGDKIVKETRNRNQVRRQGKVPGEETRGQTEAQRCTGKMRMRVILARSLVLERALVLTQIQPIL